MKLTLQKSTSKVKGDFRQSSKIETLFNDLTILFRPVGKLTQFNQNIVGKIEVIAEFRPEK